MKRIVSVFLLLISFQISALSIPQQQSFSTIGLGVAYENKPKSAAIDLTGMYILDQLIGGYLIRGTVGYQTHDRYTYAKVGAGVMVLGLTIALDYMQTIEAETQAALVPSVGIIGLLGPMEMYFGSVLYMNDQPLREDRFTLGFRYFFLDFK